MSAEQKQLSHVRYLWKDEEAAALRGLDRLVYRSNKLGEDLALTNTGGGNTSSKLLERDPLIGKEVEVLWIKGSGGDLRTTKADGFASLYLEKVRAMKAVYLSHPNRGPKTEVEDRMYPMYSHCVFNLNPRACSIDTPLHTFVPHRHVDHLHPNAVIAIAASVNQKELCKAIYGDDVIYVPWQRPGFDIGLLIESLIKENPKAKGVLLGHHGMSSWSNDDKTCYETALAIVDQAASYIEEHDRGAQTFGGQNTRRCLMRSGNGPSWKSFRSYVDSCPHRIVSSPPCKPMRPRLASSTVMMDRAWRNSAPRVRIISCAQKSSPYSLTGIL